MPLTHILVAEDDPGHRRLVELLLTKAHANARVRTVGSGGELLAAFREQPADCILLDYNLPDQRAPELLAALEKHQCDCPVLVMSSSQDQAVVIESIRQGCVDFLPKMEAFLGDVLWRRIEQALAQHRRANHERRSIERRMHKLARLAETDALTGLHNRLYLNQLLHTRRQSLDRRGQSSVLVVDIDHFKHINDRFGHPSGDEVLRTVAEELRAALRDGDTAVRWGGEEFVLALPATTLAFAMARAEKLRAAIESRPIAIDSQAISVTISIGIASSAGAQLSEEIISHADQALYVAKRQGRNRICTWNMVCFDKLLKQIERSPHTDPVARLRALLELGRSSLGPTQRDHLGSHAEFVAQLAVWLGAALELDRPELDRLRTAGRLHDLGKFVTPECVLAKNTPLATEERDLLARHSGDGADMSLRLGLDAGTAEYIRHHHAPFQCAAAASPAGTHVPLGARILAVADAFVTMTSDRSYQPARPFGAAVRELRRVRGVQFDPVVVDAVPRALLSRVPVLTDHPAKMLAAQRYRPVE